MSTRLGTSLFTAALVAGLLLPASAQALSLGGLFGSPVDAELVAQVPQDKRGAINKADYDLACANQDLALAKLKEELADKQDDLANLNTKLAKTVSSGAEIKLNIAKMEAIMAAGLGKAEDNRKVLDELTTDRSKNESERLEYTSKINQATLYVRDWTQRVAAKEKSVAEFKSRRGGANAQAAPQPAAVAKPAPGPVEEPLEIINKEPGYQPAPAATPESDLKN